MAISLLLFSIAIFDLKHHRIPNFSLLLLIVISILSGVHDFDLIYLLLISVAVALFTLLTGCGFGDSKLLIILLALVIPRYQISHFISAVLLASSILVLLHLIRFRSFRGEIAFAPALCGAVLALSP
ncbi:hypothetical protein DLE03_04380 [Actinobacteria bacterium IMCC25003]|nr:hypothetical protein DLE03_04380 [Actinobacteria bacterium IMCC25003]